MDVQSIKNAMDKMNENAYRRGHNSGYVSGVDDADDNDFIESKILFERSNQIVIGRSFGGVL